MGKRPAFQFYPSDWRTDPELGSCSLAARGLWVELMCLMHDAEPYGHLLIAGESPTDEDLARLVREAPAKVRALLAELERKKVFSRTEGGVIYSRRMVRDERVRNARAAGGSKSLQHPDVPRPKGKKGRGKDGAKDTLDPSLPGSLGGSPSSSSSSSASANNPSEDKSSFGLDAPEGTDAAPGPAPKAKRRTRKPRPDGETPLPAEWSPTDAHRKLAAKHGADVDLEAEQFRDHHTARGSRFLDWDRAFNTWLRNVPKYGGRRQAAGVAAGGDDDWYDPHQDGGLI